MSVGWCLNLYQGRLWGFWLDLVMKLKLLVMTVRMTVRKMKSDFLSSSFF